MVKRNKIEQTTEPTVMVDQAIEQVEEQVEAGNEPVEAQGDQEEDDQPTADQPDPDAEVEGDEPTSEVEDQEDQWTADDPDDQPEVDMLVRKYRQIKFRIGDKPKTRAITQGPLRLRVKDKGLRASVQIPLEGR